MIRPSLVLVACLLTPPAARAGETTIKNDSVVDFGTLAIQAGFAADEWATAWLTATCVGNLTHVQVLWQSVTGGSGNTLGQAIYVWQPGTFPGPGTPVRQLDGPSMLDGFFNEFPIVPALSMTTDEVVVVGFQFLDPPPPLGPSVVTDVDGCQPGRNGIYAIPPGAWFNACALGVAGDFAIRGVLDCATPIFADGFESGDMLEWTEIFP